MKLLETLILIIFTLLAATLLAIPTDGSSSSSASNANDIAGSKTQDQKMMVMRMRMSRCDKFPRVCRLTRGMRGSSNYYNNNYRPDCCKRKCVNVKHDRMNCGMCGHKCKYTEICCKGKCVNVSFDKFNCGGCNRKCHEGEYCVYGMCNYA